MNDIFFAVHAFALSSVQLTQIFMYDRGKQSSINWHCVCFLIVLVLLVVLDFFIEEIWPNAISQTLFTIRMCGFCKASITFVKYMPQVYLNWQRKSTHGWSLENVFLDFGGGVFSFLQIFIKAKA